MREFGPCESVGLDGLHSEVLSWLCHGDASLVHL